MEKDDTVITSFPLDEIVKVLLQYLVYACPSCHYRLYSLSLFRKLRVRTLKSSLEQYSLQGMRVIFEFVGVGEEQDNTHDVCEILGCAPCLKSLM